MEHVIQNVQDVLHAQVTVTLHVMIIVEMNVLVTAVDVVVDAVEAVEMIAIMGVFQNVQAHVLVIVTIVVAHVLVLVILYVDIPAQVIVIQAVVANVIQDVG